MARVVPKIFKEEEGAQEEKGEYARLSAYLGAIAIADLVKTTLGPKGMDKILQPISGKGNVTFTNDGATILKSIHIDNPAAKILVDVSKTQDSEIGDGTTSVAVLSGELLREAEKLVSMKIHPQTIIRGWRRAVQVARAALDDASIDHSKDSDAFKNDLLNIAKTTLSSKILSSDKNHFAQLAVSAVLRLGGSSDLSSIQILKKVGGQLQNSYLEDGFILDKRIGVGQPKRIENAKILVMNTAMDTDKIKIYAARVRVNNVSDLAEIETAEKEKMKQKVEKILKHGVNVVINRQLIYNYPEQLFTDAGVMSIEHADFEGVERLALVLDAEIASTFEHPEKAKLGRCDVIEEIVIGEDRLIRFRGVAKGAACTVVLRGSSEEVLEEAERSLHDALCVLVKTTQQPKIVYGGGCSESLMAKAVDELATRVAGKEALAVEAFARALRAIPTTLADNGGYDSSDLVARLRAAHYDAKSSSHVAGYTSPSGHWYSTAGLDMERGAVGDMSVLKITEPLAMKMQVLVSAHEAAEMILRVDNIVRNAPRKRQPDHRH